MHCMIRLLLALILLPFSWGSLRAVPPLLNYAGQVSVNGQRFDGEAKLKFALVNPAGSVTYWSHDGTSENGSEPTGHVSAQVRGGLYSILIGNTAISGMGELNASVFQQHDGVYLRVWFSDGINGFERIVPDRPFAAVPYALSAGSANISPGSISLNMLDTEVQNSLNGTIPRERLSADLLADLNRTVRLQDLSLEVSQSINRTITLSDLDSQVITELNNSITPGSISLDQLSQQVRDDINRTITKSMLSQEVLDELNATGGATGSVPGSLIAVPANQSAPSGYELYQRGEPKELVWEEKAPIDLGNLYGGVHLNGKIYTSSKCYDPIEDEWSDISPMLNAKSAYATSVLREKIYFIGGINDSGNVNDVQVYDPNSDTWSLSTPLPQAIRAMDAITVDGLLYVVGGFTTTSVGFVYCFNPDSEEWTNKAAMPTARWGANLVFFENQIWAIGGDGGGKNVVEAYNTDTNSWSSKSSLKQGREWAPVWTANDLIFVAGGRYSDSNYLNSIEIYDPLVNDWDFFGNLP